MNPEPAVAPASLSWTQVDDRWTLQLAGDWRGTPRPEAPASPAVAGQASVLVDAQGVTAWDTGSAAVLWQLLLPLRRDGVSLDLARLPAGLRDTLELALPADTAPELDLPPLPDATPWRRALALRFGEALTTASFVGNVLLALGRFVRGRAVMRGGDLLRQLDTTGPMSLPIVTLTCFLIGLILAYMGGAQLQRIGAPSFIADVVAIGMVRELAPLMTGVILAGRIGAAFAAQIGTMQANEEIDAFRALGIDPVEFLVLPRLLAMLIVAPLLIAYAALVGVVAGLPPAVGIYGVPTFEYLHEARTALSWTHLWIGLFKGTLYIVLVALAGCREGLHAGRDAQAVGAATTTAVVKGLLWIVIAASLTTIIFQRLDL